MHNMIAIDNDNGTIVYVYVLQCLSVLFKACSHSVFTCWLLYLFAYCTCCMVL